MFDFTQSMMPRKRTYDNQFQSIEYGIKQSITSYIYPIYVKTDNDLISENYQPDSLDFNVDRTEYKNYIRNPEDDIFLEFGFQMAYNEQIYYRKNIKLKDIVSSLGGILNILVLFGKIICSNYNSIIYINRVIEKSFPKPNTK